MKIKHLKGYTLNALALALTLAMSAGVAVYAGNTENLEQKPDLVKDINASGVIADDKAKIDPLSEDLSLQPSQDGFVDGDKTTAGLKSLEEQGRDAPGAYTAKDKQPDEKVGS